MRLNLLLYSYLHYFSGILSFWLWMTRDWIPSDLKAIPGLRELLILGFSLFVLPITIAIVFYYISLSPQCKSAVRTRGKSNTQEHKFLSASKKRQPHRRHLHSFFNFLDELKTRILLSHIEPKI